jgi:hypothetical protein
MLIIHHHQKKINYLGRPFTVVPNLIVVFFNFGTLKLAENNLGVSAVEAEALPCDLFEC